MPSDRDRENAARIKETLGLPPGAKISVYVGNNQKLVYGEHGQTKDTSGMLEASVVQRIETASSIKPNPSEIPKKQNPNLRVVANLNDGLKLDAYREEREGTVTVNNGYERQASTEQPKQTKQPVEKASDRPLERAAEPANQSQTVEAGESQMPKVERDSHKQQADETQARNLAKLGNLTSKVFSQLNPEQQKSARWALSRVNKEIASAATALLKDKGEAVRQSVQKAIKDFHIPTTGEVVTKLANSATEEMNKAKKTVDAATNIAETVKNAAQKVETAAMNLGDRLSEGANFIDDTLKKYQTAALLKQAVKVSQQMHNIKGDRNVRFNNGAEYRYDAKTGEATLKRIPGRGDGEAISATVDMNGKIAAIKTSVSLEAKDFSDAMRTIKNATPQNTKTSLAGEHAYKESADRIASNARAALEAHGERPAKMTGNTFSYSIQRDGTIEVHNNKSNRAVLVQTESGKVVSNRLSQDDIAKFDKVIPEQSKQVDKQTETRKEVELAR